MKYVRTYYETAVPFGIQHLTFESSLETRTADGAAAKTGHHATDTRIETITRFIFPHLSRSAGNYLIKASYIINETFCGHQATRGTCKDDSWASFSD